MCAVSLEPMMIHILQDLLWERTGDLGWVRCHLVLTFQLWEPATFGVDHVIKGKKNSMF